MAKVCAQASDALAPYLTVASGYRSSEAVWTVRCDETCHQLCAC